MPNAYSSMAAPSELSGRARELLSGQLDELCACLTPLLEDSLFALRRQLGESAVEHFDDGLMAAIRSVLERKLTAFEQPLPPSTDDSSGSGTDLAREESALLDEIASHAELGANLQLFELGYRHGVLAAKAPCEPAELALGPRALLARLQDVASAAGMSPERRMLWYRLLDRPLENVSGDIFRALNRQLIAHGILPSLRPHLPRLGEVTDPGAQESRASAPAAAPVTALHELLLRRRELLKLDSGPPNGEPASAEVVQAALALLQQRVAGGNQTDTRSVQKAVQHLREDLLAELRRFARDGVSLRLSADQRDTLDLMALWFERLLDETRSGGGAQRLLARLQLPMLRAALADSSLLGTRTHPARRLLNAVLETTDLWIDGSEGEIDNVLLGKLRAAAERVLASFNGDPASFEQQAVEIEDHVRTLRRRSEVLERRQREAAQGRERLELARSHAAAAIAAQMAGHEPDALIRALLEQAWTDALALAILRDGEGSEACTRVLNVAAQLLAGPGQRDEARLLADLEAGLVQVGLHASEASQLAHRVLDRASPVAGKQASQTEMLVKLKNHQRLGESDDIESGSGPQLTDDEQHQLARLLGMPFDTWFECTINDQGQRVQRKLIWYGNNHRCLLVNARGVASSCESLKELARQLAAGRTRLLPRQEESMVDRAWHTVVASLRQFGRVTQAAATPHQQRSEEQRTGLTS